MAGWIGVDLDGTLVMYDHGNFRPSHVGEPVPKMLQRVKAYLRKGVEIRIFTARVTPLNTCIEGSMTEEELTNLRAEVLRMYDQSYQERIHQAFDSLLAIREWTRKHLGVCLSVTNVKDYEMIRVYDDRARQVEENTGVVVGDVGGE